MPVCDASCVMACSRHANSVSGGGPRLLLRINVPFCGCCLTFLSLSCSKPLRVTCISSRYLLQVRPQSLRCSSAECTSVLTKAAGVDLQALQKSGALGKVQPDVLKIFSRSRKLSVFSYSQGKYKLSLPSWLQYTFVHLPQLRFYPIIFETVKTNSQNVPHLCSAFVKLLIQILLRPPWVQLLLLNYLTVTVVLSLQDIVKFTFCLSPGYCC